MVCFGLVWFGMHPAHGSVRPLDARPKAWGADCASHRHRAGTPRAHPRSALGEGGRGDRGTLAGTPLLPLWSPLKAGGDHQWGNPPPPLWCTAIPLLPCTWGGGGGAVLYEKVQMLRQYPPRVDRLSCIFKVPPQPPSSLTPPLPPGGPSPFPEEVDPLLEGGHEHLSESLPATKRTTRDTRAGAPQRRAVPGVEERRRTSRRGYL